MTDSNENEMKNLLLETCSKCGTNKYKESTYDRLKRERDYSDPTDSDYSDYNDPNDNLPF